MSTIQTIFAAAGQAASSVRGRICQNMQLVVNDLQAALRRDYKHNPVSTFSQACAELTHVADDSAMAEMLRGLLKQFSYNFHQHDLSEEDNYALIATVCGAYDQFGPQSQACLLEIVERHFLHKDLPEQMLYTNAATFYILSPLGHILHDKAEAVSREVDPDRSIQISDIFTPQELAEIEASLTEIDAVAAASSAERDEDEVLFGRFGIELTPIID